MEHTGQHIIADFYNVDCTSHNLNEAHLKKFISTKILENNLTELGNHYHTFDKVNEITCIIALAESHISIHTWPEKQYVSLDIFVCNLNTNNSKKAENLYENFFHFFSPGKVKKQIIKR